MNENDKRKILRRVIVLCWVSLIFCMVIKMIGGNYFEIIANNERFIKLCSWLETTFISTIIMYSFYILNLYFIISIMSNNELKNKKLIPVIPISVFLCFIKGISSVFGFVLETVFMLIFPLFISNETKKKTFKRSIITYLWINIFQLLSLFIRNIDAQLVNANFCISLLFQIDYYIMLILYYLYSVKMKGDENMGQWGVLWFGNDVAMDKGYAKFIKVMSLIGIVLTFPISVPYLLWKKHKKNKVVTAKK